MRVPALVLAGLLSCTARTSTDSTKGEIANSDAASPPARAEPVDPVAQLRPFEEEARRAFDFANPPSAETGVGADPWALRHLPRLPYWVGILRGRSALVLLDEELHELARVPAPRSPTGLALGKNGEILVVGELSQNLARYVVQGAALVALPEVHVAGVLGLRDVAASPAGAVWVLDERGGRALRLGADGHSSASVGVGHGAVSLLATTKHLVVNAVTEHTLDVFALDAGGNPVVPEPVRITHDGPMWGIDARETAGGLVVAAGGVEDHPLDRSGGFFGFIDSFVFAYRVQDARIEALGTFNASALGVVTPKAIAIEAADANQVDLFVTGYGSATALRASLRPGQETQTEIVTLVPGLRTLERDATGKKSASASPLLDAWVAIDERGVARVVPVPAGPNEAPRSAASRLGEALFFTSLMAPNNTSTGALSRFTCETCHFEGYVDGRTHHTGRADVHATTKPLVGLAGNRPYFSRALDPDLSTVSHAEFRVAGAGSETDPFFAVDPQQHPWLAHLGVSESVSALDLRRALMRFLMDFSHRPNAAVVGRSSFAPLEREGARVFGERCESCHAARLSADAPETRVASERWEALIMSDAAPIVWGSAGYRKTGIVPYVSSDGARTPSLRRLSKKYPYFTNGSARSIADVLDAVRFEGATTSHGRAAGAAETATGTSLDAGAKRALSAFLELL